MTDNKVSYIITTDNISVNYQGETHIIKRGSVLADKLIAAIKDGDLSSIPDLVSAEKRIEKLSDGQFHVKNGRVQINGVDAPEYLSNKIVQFAREGLPFQPLLRFAENLQANPSFRAVNELYGFLEQNDCPITSDGLFIAYRRVRADYKDIYSGTFDNSPGNVIEMPRNQVNEDSNITCSHGFHAASWEYSHNYYGSDNRDTDIMLEVEINPADVVAIPSDYSNGKMRICKYKVLGVVKTPFQPEVDILRHSKSENKYEDCQYNEEEYCEDCDELKSDCQCEYCDTCDALVDDEYDYCGECGHYYDGGDIHHDYEDKSKNEVDHQDTYQAYCSFCGNEECFGECQDLTDEDRGRHR